MKKLLIRIVLGYLILFIIIVLILATITQDKTFADSTVTANHINYDISINNFMLKKDNIMVDFVNYEGSTYISVNQIKRILCASGVYSENKIQLYYQNQNNADLNKQNQYGQSLIIEGWNSKNSTSWESMTSTDRVKQFATYNEGMKYYNSIAYKDDPFKTELVIKKDGVEVRLNGNPAISTDILIKNGYLNAATFVKLSDIANLFGSTISFDNVNRVLNIINTNNFNENTTDRSDLAYFETNCIFLTNIYVPVYVHGTKDFYTHSYDVDIMATNTRYLEISRSAISTRLDIEIFGYIPFKVKKI